MVLHISDYVSYIWISEYIWHIPDKLWGDRLLHGGESRRQKMIWICKPLEGVGFLERYTKSAIVEDRFMWEQGICYDIDVNICKWSKWCVACGWCHLEQRGRDACDANGFLSMFGSILCIWRKKTCRNSFSNNLFLSKTSEMFVKIKYLRWKCRTTKYVISKLLFMKLQFHPIWEYLDVRQALC